MLYIFTHIYISVLHCEAKQLIAVEEKSFSSVTADIFFLVGGADGRHMLQAVVATAERRCLGCSYCCVFAM